MIQAIREAGEQLHTAWEQYLQACSTIDDYKWQGKTHYDLPRGFLQQIENELARFSGYKVNVQKVQRTLKKAHQRASHLMPIHTLPSEILLRIFFILLVEPCYFGQFNRTVPLPRNQNLDCITQVCSRWRSIATSCPFFWTHVDIPLVQASFPRLLPRVRIHLQRTSNLPLEIHIHDTGTDRSERGYDPLIQFLETVASRMGTLKLVLDYPYYRPFHISILEAILSNCSPEIFTRLITISSSDATPYISSGFEYSEMDMEGESNEGSDIEDYERCLNLGLPESQIEAGFSGLTALDLKGCYPCWSLSSSAYHGLVDLRLSVSPNPDAEIPAIHKSELINILNASPGLKIFYFRLRVVGQAIKDTVALPIYLKDLEVVNLSTEFPRYNARLFNFADVLRLLGPGLKPLRLTLDAGEDGKELIASTDELRNFFARSKVEKLCLRRVDHFSEWVLIHTPDVQVLVLEDCCFGRFGKGVSGSYDPNNSENSDDSADSDSDDSNDSNYDTSLMLPRVHFCYILGGAIMDVTLRNLARLCPTGLILEFCQVYTGPKTYIPNSEIPKIFPAVICQSESVLTWSDLTADWDVLG